MNHLFRYAYLGMWGTLGLVVMVSISLLFVDDLPFFGSHDRNIEYTYETCRDRLRKQRVRLKISQQVCTCLSENFDKLPDFNPKKYRYRARDLVEDLREYCVVRAERLEAELDRKRARRRR